MLATAALAYASGDVALVKARAKRRSLTRDLSDLELLLCMLASALNGSVEDADRRLRLWEHPL